MIFNRFSSDLCNDWLLLINGPDLIEVLMVEDKYALRSYGDAKETRPVCSWRSPM
jgi:hypothetical protein